MPRGDKSAYTAKQRRQAEHIEEGYRRRGVPEKEAERRAWATENAMTGGGRKSGSGRGKKVNKAPARLALRLVFLPRPEPLFLPPPVSLFTVAHARRSASFFEVPRFS